jgi:CTP-dependent riboflavin kinase
MTSIFLSDKQRKMMAVALQDAQCVTDESEKERLRRLGNRGLVKRWFLPSGVWYQTTEKGKAYLRGRYA